MLAIGLSKDHKSKDKTMQIERPQAMPLWQDMHVGPTEPIDVLFCLLLGFIDPIVHTWLRLG